MVTNINTVIALSKTTTTLQVVANPLLNEDTSPVAKRAWQSLADLGADYVRYVPWFPYPLVGVAELLPPNAKQTFWNFEYILPQFKAFMNATQGQGHTTIPNFSTQPTWMFNTSDWSYPLNPNKVDWSYPKGGLYSNTTQKVAEYYGRLLSWIVKGEFVDELGNVITGGPRFPLTHWEIFNEIEFEHNLSPQEYTKMYDAIVKQIRLDADPNHKIQFVGLALGTRNTATIAYFIDPSNHDPDVLPLDYISFHFYASGKNRVNASTYEDFFPQADQFFKEAANIQSIRRVLNPSVKIDVDEIGCILADDNDSKFTAFPLIYWNACGAMYAYLWANIVPLQFEVLGQSQLAGCPAIHEWGILDSQYPSVSLLNWTTGIGNPRYWILKLLLQNFQPGDTFLHTTSSVSSVFAQVIVSSIDKSQKILLVNKKNSNVCVQIPSLTTNVNVAIIDESVGDNPARVQIMSQGTITLAPFAVAVVNPTIQKQAM